MHEIRKKPLLLLIALYLLILTGGGIASVLLSLGGAVTSASFQSLLAMVGSWTAYGLFLGFLLIYGILTYFGRGQQGSIFMSSLHMFWLNLLWGIVFAVSILPTAFPTDVSLLIFWRLAVAIVVAQGCNRLHMQTLYIWFRRAQTVQRQDFSTMANNLLEMFSSR